jgi:hypothetical protein
MGIYNVLISILFMDQRSFDQVAHDDKVRPADGHSKTAPLRNYQVASACYEMILKELEVVNRYGLEKLSTNLDQGTTRVERLTQADRDTRNGDLSPAYL